MSLDLKNFVLSFHQEKDTPKFTNILRRMEISRKAYSAYDEGSWKESSSTPADQETIASIVDIALSLSLQKGDFKPLNSALKILDDHLVLPKFQAPEEQKARALRILNDMEIS